MSDPTITPPPPIVVPASPLDEQTLTLVRDIAKLVGAGLVTHGFVSKDNLDLWTQVIAGVVIATLPMVLSQLKTRMNWGKLAKLEAYAPDSVAVKQVKS